MTKAVLFDLDGTLLPNDEKLFAEIYFATLARRFTKYGIKEKDFVDALNYGAMKMVYNDGKETNETVFINGLKEKLNIGVKEIDEVINDYYENEYREAYKALGKDIDAVKCVKLCKQKGLKVILASNPLFPKIAYLNRACYNDLKEDYFDEITSYDLYHYAKPNPEYYKEILSRHNLKVDEVIFFGNSQNHDINPASSIGIKSYLVHDHNSMSSKEMLDIINNI